MSIYFEIKSAASNMNFLQMTLEQKHTMNYNIARFNMNETKTHIKLWNKCEFNVISICMTVLLISDNIQVYRLPPSPWIGKR
jgi:hypothetical protein